MNMILIIFGKIVKKFVIFENRYNCGLMFFLQLKLNINNYQDTYDVNHNKHNYNYYIKVQAALLINKLNKQAYTKKSVNHEAEINRATLVASTVLTIIFLQNAGTFITCVFHNLTYLSAI